MRLPRDFSGRDLAKRLEHQYGHRVIWTKGSHMRFSVAEAREGLALFPPFDPIFPLFRPRRSRHDPTARTADRAVLIELIRLLAVNRVPRREIWEQEVPGSNPGAPIELTRFRESDSRHAVRVGTDHHGDPVFVASGFPRPTAAFHPRATRVASVSRWPTLRGCRPGCWRRSRRWVARVRSSMRPAVTPSGGPPPSRTSGRPRSAPGR